MIESSLWLFVVACWALYGAVWDLRFRRLPDHFTLGGAGIGVGHLLLYGSSVLGASWMSSCAAGIGAIVLLSPFCALGILGAGDVKMMSAIGLLGGTQILLTTFVFSSLLTLPVVTWIFLRCRWRQDSFEPVKLRLPQGTLLSMGLIIAMTGLVLVP